MKLHTRLGKNSYDIIIERRSLERAKDLLDLDRKVMIVTDSGVPKIYARKIEAASKDAFIVTVKKGEASKSLKLFEALLKIMLENSFTRRDCVVAVGGGVVGDLAGFAASAYMRGIDFYNVPTTVLSQVDSSVGGKTAVDLLGVKNIVGAFYQPKKVLIDPETLKTLDDRQIAAGLCEGLKMAAVFDKDLFGKFENGVYGDRIEDVIAGALRIKINVVEHDEKEKDMRKLLNFGHTVGHGIESAYGDRYFHGECVALGMLPMCSAKAGRRIRPVLEKLGLPTKYDFDLDRVFEAVSHDKKGEGDGVTAVFLDGIGEYRLKKTTVGELRKRVEKYQKKDKQL